MLSRRSRPARSSALATDAGEGSPTSSTSSATYRWDGSNIGHRYTQDGQTNNGMTGDGAEEYVTRPVVIRSTPSRRSRTPMSAGVDRNWCCSGI